MKKNKVILIGAINEGNVPTCGETMKNQLFVKRFNELFDEVITVDTLNWHKRPWILVKLFFTLLFNHGAKVIISASSSSANKLIRLLYHLRLKKDVYYWVIGGLYHKLVAQGQFNTKYLHFLKGIFVQGQEMVDVLVNLGLNNVVYVPNSKYINYLPPCSLKGQDEKLHFVFLSRVHPDKGCDYILKSVEQLNVTHKGLFDVTFYGNLDMSYASFKEQIEKIDNIMYKGLLNLLNNDGYNELSQYDVMLFPTFWDGEGFPGVIIDAYIASLPVIATDWNLNKTVIKDGETGWIIPIHSVEWLKKAMEDAINNREKVREMAKNCNIKAMDYDSRTILSDIFFRKIGLL